MQHLISRRPQATGSKMPSYTLPPESSQSGCGLLPTGILAVILFCFLKSDCPALPTSWPERGPALCPGEDSLSFVLMCLFCICPLASRCNSARSPACWLSSVASIQIPQPSLRALPPWPHLCTAGLMSCVPCGACLSLLGCVPSHFFPLISPSDPTLCSFIGLDESSSHTSGVCPMPWTFPELQNPDLVILA